MYTDRELLPISALQHFLFCERQCALIHIEMVWQENLYTIEGEILHKRVHSETWEQRPAGIKEFGMPVRSLVLGLVGKTDAVEYKDDGSIVIVEYKRGKPKKSEMDEVQLCAQAICLEEMLDTVVYECALYSGKTKHRRQIPLTDELRRLTADTAKRLHSFIDAGITPPAVYKHETCDRCSLAGVCMPKKFSGSSSIDKYLTRMLRKEVQCP